MSQIDLFATPADHFTQSAETNALLAPASPASAGIHRPDRWWPAARYPEHEVAACLGCSRPLFRRSEPDAPLEVYDAHRRVLVPAAPCPGRSRVGLTLEGAA